jgi:hypothetical protein
MMDEHLISRSIALALCLVAAVANAQTAKLVVADAEGWTTTVEAKNETATTTSVPVTDCASGPTHQLRMEPAAQAIARNIGPYLCALRGTFGLVDVPDVGRMETQLRHRDATGLTSFYVVPALRVKLTKKDDSARVPMIVNDDEEQTWVILFGDPGPITFEILNEHGTLVHTEVVNERDFIAPWKMLVYPIKQSVPIGTLVVTEGDKTRPTLPVDPETYYGFAVIGARDGSSNLVREWE